MVMGIPTVPMTDVEGRYVSAGKDYYVNEGKVTNRLHLIPILFEEIKQLMLLVV